MTGYKWDLGREDLGRGSKQIEEIRVFKLIVGI
jgi:hypothetical protein